MKYEESTIQDIIKRRGYRENVKGDKFSLYISNYPVNAKYLKARIGNEQLILAELCCSIGVTLEYLAPGFKKVIGVDLDKDILKMCQANLEEAGLMVKTELILGDAFDDNILKNIEADIVIYDIPFWYPHEQENQGDLVIKNPPIKELIKKIQDYITSDIIIFSPPEWNYESVKEQLGKIEFEQVFIESSHNRNQIYMGSLIKKEGETQISLKTGYY
ncbi:class I SAM-dependent methyltransferase [uncultured Croceitalea sp.]|uniref:class I SAM-dependent methyltransferase n=1 Tax=uncultured Croceitalea sp. TaxID=1798908 RepID=UPI0033058037